MNKIKHYRTYAFVDKDTVDIFIDALYARLKTLNPKVNYEVNHGSNITSISFDLDKLKEYYMFQVDKAAKIANIPMSQIGSVRRGNKAVIRIKH